jgi:hypothetical protein
MEGGKVPAVKERQFYKDDYGTMMHEYEKHLQHGQKMQEKKVKKTPRPWTNFDQEFEEFLWDN